MRSNAILKNEMRTVFLRELCWLLRGGRGLRRGRLRSCHGLWPVLLVEEGEHVCALESHGECLRNSWDTSAVDRTLADLVTPDRP